MENEIKKEVEEVSPQQEENVTDVTVETSKNEAPVDFEAVATQAMSIADEATKQLEKSESDKENYKKGMLAKEKKLKELKDQGYEVSEEGEKLTLAQIEEAIDKKLSTIQIPENSEKVSLQKQVSELKIALTNRKGLPSSPAGNSTEGQEVKPARWVDDPAQKASLVARGLDPEKVYENWKKNQRN